MAAAASDLGDLERRMPPRASGASHLRTLVFAIAWGYPSAVYENYAKSLRATGYGGDIAFFVGGTISLELVETCRRVQAAVVPLNRSALFTAWNFSKYGYLPPNPSIVRFHWYRQACTEERYTVCVGTDLRDVFFQRDPVRHLLHGAARPLPDLILPLEAISLFPNGPPRYRASSLHKMMPYSQYSQIPRNAHSVA